ncbi:MAG: zinc-dependent metalloprotease [Planctomycetales bacterium]|nr:zinc-dependent metalloprotease [Planctomycetales bacterium]
MRWQTSRFIWSLLVITLLGNSLSTSVVQGADYPPFEKVIEGFTKVEPPTDSRAMYELYVNEKEGQLLIELPKNFADPSKKYFIGVTVASGQVFAGLQAGDYYVQWRQYNKRLALIEPNTSIRSGGDRESKDSVDRLFTGRVLLDLPIITMSPRGGPVIDGDQLFVGNASTFFGGSGRTTNPSLAKLVKNKVFPQNIELAFELPSTSGTLQTLYYSVSELPQNTGYSPRQADQRIGYFTTSYSDYGKYEDDTVDVNFINRWHLQKRDPSLKVSPPLEPIQFYLEHTTPVRYRRWIKAGVEYWNKAFERVGLSDAIQVHYQDKATKAYMDLDPEDVRYNFIRWLNNDIGTAIGPSRVHPETGQILDADIILTDGWIRHFNEQFQDYMPLIALDGMSAETLTWLSEHPNWDPRVRFAQPSQRLAIESKLRQQAASPNAGTYAGELKTKLLGDDPFDGLFGRTSQVNGLCLAAQGRRIDTSMMRMLVTMNMLEDEKPEDGDKKDDPKKDEPKKPEEPMLDGMPESFIGPLLADLVAHEVGHTLGLRHNFKASSIFSLKEINSPELKEKKAFAGSVMDYLPINYRVVAGEVQGDYGMIDIGPYDYWAIEYGYTFDKDLKPILARVSEPELAFATDEDTGGPDPLARRYDFAKDPLDFAKEQTLLIERFRKRLLSDYVKNGDSWKKAREGYELTLGLQGRITSMMTNWIGGAFVNRDKKGDPNDRLPIEVVPVAQQRAALQFVLSSNFKDEAYALSPDLLSRLMLDFFDRRFSDDPAWPVHDRILSMQSSALTQLMNPTTLRHVYDNEFRIPADQEALTLPELLSTISKEIWQELEGDVNKEFTDRAPMISSLRRNLQEEHMDRLIDLSFSASSGQAAQKAISNLCVLELQNLKTQIDKRLESKTIDVYTRAHLVDASKRIEKALDAEYSYNQNSGRSSGIIFTFGENAQEPAQSQE